jgi:3-hydroxyacyl-[acyl-carrier-protein] dehydratase
MEGFAGRVVENHRRHTTMNPTSLTNSTTSPNQGTAELFGHRVVSPSTDDDACLREMLKRYSAATLEAARQLRKTRNPDYLPAFVTGVIERFVEPDRRAKLRPPSDDLCLAEDLGIDSLTLMEVVLLAEEVLPISISNDELRRLRTLGEIKRFVADKLVRGSGQKTTTA